MEGEVYVAEIWPHVHSIAPDCREFLRRNESIPFGRFFSQHQPRGEAKMAAFHVYLEM